MKFIGYGVSTDVVEASAKAYINAVNRMMSGSYELGKRGAEACIIAKNFNYFGEGADIAWEFELT